MNMHARRTAATTAVHWGGREQDRGREITVQQQQFFLCLFEREKRFTMRHKTEQRWHVRGTVGPTRWTDV